MRSSVLFHSGGVLVTACLILAACSNQPSPYAPPMQRRPMTGPDTSRLKHFIAMNDPAAMDHILEDVNPTLEGGSWRWTGQKPLLRFVLPKTNNLRFVMDFVIAEQTFQSTGPLTITWHINSHLLDKVTYPAAGEKHFEKLVPDSWIRRGDDTVVSTQLDKVYVAPDGVKLGITLLRAGFLD